MEPGTCTMGRVVNMSGLGIWVLVVVQLFVGGANGECFPAIFNFGDSTSDSGGIHATFPRLAPSEFKPYGSTYPGTAWNKFSDGRLQIDFIAQALGLKYLTSAMQPVDSDYSQGCNFATAGATVMPITYMSPFPLPVQYLQFLRFQQDVIALRSDPATPVKLLSRIPEVDAFSKGLYTIALGGNDFTFGYNKEMTIEEVDEYLPTVADGLVNAVKLLYEAGGRNFIVWDIEPHGCVPYFLTAFGRQIPEEFDEHGCLIAFNEASVRFNTMLREKIAKAREDLPEINLHMVSTYDIKINLGRNLTANGFKYDLKACCGVPSEYNYHLQVNCGKTKTLKGVTYEAVKCDDPSEYTVWDGVHNTQAASRYIAKMVLSGSFFDVPFPELTENCELNPFD
ncbi:unnamed protein product [Calypogeia fissa]